MEVSTLAVWAARWQPTLGEAAGRHGLPRVREHSRRCLDGPNPLGLCMCMHGTLLLGEWTRDDWDLALSGLGIVLTTVSDRVRLRASCPGAALSAERVGEPWPHITVSDASGAVWSDTRMYRVREWVVPRTRDRAEAWRVLTGDWDDKLLLMGFERAGEWSEEPCPRASVVEVE